MYVNGCLFYVEPHTAEEQMSVCIYMMNTCMYIHTYVRTCMTAYVLHLLMYLSPQHKFSLCNDAILSNASCTVLLWSTHVRITSVMAWWVDVPD